jgi:hypothetical protein
MCRRHANSLCVKGGPLANKSLRFLGQLVGSLNRRSLEYDAAEPQPNEQETFMNEAKEITPRYRTELLEEA